MGFEKCDLSLISNGQWYVCWRGFNIDIKHIKGCKNQFADALSRRPLKGVESAPDYPLFSNPCVARAIYGVKGEPDYGDDVQDI